MTEQEIKEFWEWCLSKKVEKRFGFYDESGFTEMQSNPYEKGKYSHLEKALCYLEKDRPLTAEEEAEYSEDLKRSRILAIPDRAQYWIPVPPIDLNNLFKWAVPKYIELDSSGDSPNNIDNAYRRLFERWLKRLHWDNWQNPALSLALVIKEGV